MSARVFVTGLSVTLSEEQLLTLFAPFGATGVTVPRDLSCRPRVAFVRLADHRLAAAIRANNGREVHGSRLGVVVAQPAVEQAPDRGEEGRPRYR